MYYGFRGSDMFICIIPAVIESKSIHLSCLSTKTSAYTKKWNSLLLNPVFSDKPAFSSVVFIQ